MPVVDWVVDTYGYDKPFVGWDVLFIQHQLENHMAQTEAMFECGMEASRLHWIDIPYTSSPIIREHLIDKYSVPSEQFYVHDYNLTQQYAPYQRARVIGWIKHYLEKSSNENPLLVVDDGGYFLEALVCLKDHPDKLTLVEQTTRGINKIRDNDAVRYYFSHIPVVDVVTSPPKKNLESPFIAEAVCASVEERLQVILEDKGISLNEGKVLVLGFGDIGSSVAAELKQKFGVNKNQIFIYDTSSAKCLLAEKAGYKIWKKTVNDIQFRLVVGCTGKKSFDVWDYVHLNKNAVLISASSGASELAREGFVELADSSEVDDIYVKDRDTLDKKNIHYDIELSLVDHNVTIANGGFPINFDGYLNRIAAEDIQITIALMVFGSIQAVNAHKENKEGIQVLDREFCSKLRKQFLNNKK